MSRQSIIVVSVGLLGALAGACSDDEPVDQGDRRPTVAVPNQPSPGTAVAPEACAGKACGVACSTADGDESYNCNASGECVAPGSVLDCDTL